jgi:hypothetical protein
MDLVIFEENKPFIVRSFRDGEFDYMEAASEVFEADFFRFIKESVTLVSKSSASGAPLSVIVFKYFLSFAYQRRSS